MSAQSSEQNRPRLDLDPSSIPPLADGTATTAGLPQRDRTIDGAASVEVSRGYGGYRGGDDAAYGMRVGGDQIHLMDYVRVLHRRRWTAITAFLMVLGFVTLYTFTATPIYEARAQLLIESEEQKVVQFQQVLDENRTTNDYYQTQYRILESRALARRTLNAENLWTHPLFAPAPEAERSPWNPLGWFGAAGNIVAEWVRGRREPRGTAETEAQSVAIDRFLGNLTISPIRNSRLVQIRYKSPDPQLSSRIANALSKQYIEQNLEFKFLATKEATEFLSERMSEQRKALEHSEQALQKYREQTGAVALEDRQNIVVQRLADLNAAVTRARTERIEKEAVYKQISEIQHDRAALDTVPAILTNSFIQQLKGQLSDLQRQQAQMAEKLGDRHPEMVKVRTAVESTEVRIAAEVQKVVQALRNDYQAALSNERALMASLEQQRAEAQELNRAAIQYGVLARDTATNRLMFEGLLQRSKETDISGELKTSNIRVVDQAEAPRTPSNPNVRNNVLLGFLGGLLLGIGLGFFFEYLDNRVKTPDEIKTQLGLPYLGMIPAIDTNAVTGPPLVSNGVPHHFSEAFRAIRTNVLFSSVEEGSKSIVVTSTAPGEGKTIVSANLAMSLAAAGQRALLIDADMRRPKIHELFRLNLEPGLSNVIVGNGKASDAVKKTAAPNLWVVTAGKHPPNPAELLGSKRFREFLTSLEQHFDWVVLDTAPVMSVTDAVVVAHHAHGVLFVVGSEMIQCGTARHAVEQLEATKSRFFGAVLNRVNFERNAYYYSRYYRRKYTDYYDKNL